MKVAGCWAGRIDAILVFSYGQNVGTCNLAGSRINLDR